MHARRLEGTLWKFSWTIGYPILAAGSYQGAALNSPEGFMPSTQLQIGRTVFDISDPVASALFKTAKDSVLFCQERQLSVHIFYMVTEDVTRTVSKIESNGLRCNCC